MTNFGLGTLVGRSLRRVAPANLGLAAVLGGFQLLLVGVAASYERAGSFDQLAMLLPEIGRAHV